MKLREWLDREQVSFAEFGGIIARTGEAVRRYASGDRIPARETMALIVEATRGEVTANDFFDIGSSSVDVTANSAIDVAASPDIAGENIAQPVPEPIGAALPIGTSGRPAAHIAAGPAVTDAAPGFPPKAVAGAAGDGLAGSAV